MKKFGFAFAGAMALFAVLGSADATVLKFDNFPEASSTFDFRGSVVSEGGFTLTNNHGTADSLGQWTNASGYDGDPIGHALFVNYGGTTTTIASATNAAFDFNSIDLGDVFNDGSSGNISIAWDIFGGGTGALLVALDSLVGLQTFAVNALGVTAVKITALTTPGPWLQLDNVVVNSQVSTVPLPATLPLLLSGFAGLAALRRRMAKTI